MSARSERARRKRQAALNKALERFSRAMSEFMNTMVAFNGPEHPVKARDWPRFRRVIRDLREGIRNLERGRFVASKNKGPIDLQREMTTALPPFEKQCRRRYDAEALRELARPLAARLLREFYTAIVRLLGAGDRARVNRVRSKDGLFAAAHLASELHSKATIATARKAMAAREKATNRAMP